MFLLDGAVKAWLPFIIGGGVLLVALIVLLIFLLKLRKPKEKHIKVDDEFTNNLLQLLGSKENIEEVTVDNGRLKIKVKDLDLVNLNGIKEIATSGVFVTGNVIKTLFKLDSQTIKNALIKVI